MFFFLNNQLFLQCAAFPVHLLTSFTFKMHLLQHATALQVVGMVH